MRYKMELQEKLEQRLGKGYYQIDDLVRLLGLKRNQAKKAFKKLPNYGDGIRKDDVIRRLMGNRLY